MKYIQFPLSLSIIALLLPLNSLQLSAAMVHQESWQISQAFKPPKRQGPPVSAGGSTRGSSSCITENKSLTPLIPTNKLGLTFSERPTLFWFVPQNSAKTANLALVTYPEKKLLYETTLTLPNKSGIIGYTLPENSPTLEIGKTYRWYLTLACNQQDFSGNPTVDGWVERIQPDSSISQALAKANARNLPSIYAEAGIWYEALASLVQLRRSEPKNLTHILNWRQFLQSVKLSAIASEPLLTIQNSKFKIQN
ncbi:DUF928 domain-containing protein [Nostoc sp. MS1]|uniref:DUF928 domain-containing protein n=1 Tax=Nostoc sp. MS1 TaxID=2764711 RepID=UPI001CC380B4|nr:DUF928 domain-containing protein [Nostoc sp. MS1]BCL36581.1 hypothetical protein NSMS1_30280 [Nostoc sp. MS1]